MDEPQAQIIPRGETHGEHMTLSDEMSDPRPAVHCCDCWRYTDDKSERTVHVDNAGALHRQLVVTAGDILTHDTVVLQASDAWKAADAFLTAQFKAAGTGSKLPKF